MKLMLVVMLALLVAGALFYHLAGFARMACAVCAGKSRESRMHIFGSYRNECWWVHRECTESFIRSHRDVFQVRSARPCGSPAHVTEAQRYVIAEDSNDVEIIR